MCGFGDKDRRPITPPPCIRLIVRDAAGNELGADDVDSTFFVLSVDLWDADGVREVNLVRHSGGAPTVSISSSTTTSFPPPPERPTLMVAQAMVPGYSTYGRPPALPPQYQPPSVEANYYHPHATSAPNYGYAATPQQHPYSSHSVMPVPVVPPPSTATGMFTRNLIGSLTVNAFKLVDTENKMGFWFILQDLSVRTEGSFRYVLVKGHQFQVC
jgi:hypothetical protein